MIFKIGFALAVAGLSIGGVGIVLLLIDSIMRGRS